MKLLETKTIKIGEKEYALKMSIRAMIEYEQISGHPISTIETLSDITIIFYCTIKAGGLNVTYDQFMDMIDDKPEALKAFTDTMIEKVEKKPKAR
mgnify:CR=1 FL=1